MALIPDDRIYRRVGVCLLHRVLCQPPGDEVRHLRLVLRLHGAAVTWTIVANWLHRLLLMPVVYTEDLRLHQGVFVCVCVGWGGDGRESLGPVGGYRLLFWG